MKVAIPIFMLTILIFSSCRQKQNEKISKKTHSENLIDTNRIAIIPYDTTRNKGFGGYKQAELSAKNIMTIDSILHYCIKKHNMEGLKLKMSSMTELNSNKSDFLIDLNDYKRQYIPLLNIKGEKEVLIRCFRSTTNKNWKKEEVIIKDSQKRYFIVWINLKTEKFTDDTGQYLNLK